MNIIRYLLTLITLVPTISLGGVPWQEALLKPIDPNEAIVKVPDFCFQYYVRAGATGVPRKDYLNAKYGVGNGHLNHYCDSRPKWDRCFNYPEKEKQQCFLSLLEGPSYALKNDNGSTLKPLLMSERAFLLQQGGKHSEAISEYQASIKAYPKYIRSYTGLADVYIELKQYADAINILEKAIKIFPNKNNLQKKLEKIKKKQ